MTLEFFRTITPFINLALMLGLGLIGWIIRRLLVGMESRLQEIRHETTRRFEKIDLNLERLEAARTTDQRRLYENFVTKEWFFLDLKGKDSSLSQIQKQLETLDQTIKEKAHTIFKTG